MCRTRDTGGPRCVLHGTTTALLAPKRAQTPPVAPRGGGDWIRYDPAASVRLTAQRVADIFTLEETMEDLTPVVFSTGETCSPDHLSQRQRLLSVLSVIFRGTSNVFAVHACLRAALKEGQHSPHISSVYGSLRREQPQLTYAEKIYVDVVVRK